jgi:hypothetical protein
MISNISLDHPEIRHRDLIVRRDMAVLRQKLWIFKFWILYRTAKFSPELFLELIPKQHVVYIKLNGYLIPQLSHYIWGHAIVALRLSHRSWDLALGCTPAQHCSLNPRVSLSSLQK